MRHSAIVGGMIAAMAGLSAASYGREIEYRHQPRREPGNPPPPPKQPKRSPNQNIYSLDPRPCYESEKPLSKRQRRRLRGKHRSPTP